MARICVFHLVWPPLGTAPLRNFLASYERFTPRVDHRLVLLVKQSRNDLELAPIRQICDDYGAESVAIPDQGFDVSAYFEAARTHPEPYCCFLNSYSEVCDEAWLEKLFQPHENGFRGITGATGSFESVFSREQFLYQRQVTALAQAFEETRPGKFDHMLERARQAKRFFQHWRRKALLFRHYPPFPNAHLRTNGFLIARELMLRLEYRTETTKADTLRFESGRDSMTRQVQRMGFQTLVVGCNGALYTPAQWPQSRTFRSGAQDNLLISDNRTREFLDWDIGERAFWSEITWGLRRDEAGSICNDDR